MTNHSDNKNTQSQREDIISVFSKPINSNDSAEDVTVDFTYVYENISNQFKHILFQLANDDTTVVAYTRLLDDLDKFVNEGACKIMYTDLVDFIVFRDDNKVSISSNYMSLNLHINKFYNFLISKDAPKIPPSNRANIINFLLRLIDHIHLTNLQVELMLRLDNISQNEQQNMLAQKFQDNKNQMIDIERRVSSKSVSFLVAFTALAFLIFGNIMTLDKTLNITDSNLLNSLISINIWGLICFDMIYMFFAFTFKLFNDQSPESEASNKSFKDKVISLKRYFFATNICFGLTFIFLVGLKILVLIQ